MADQGVSRLPGPMNTARTMSNSVQKASPSTSATVQHSGGVDAVPSSVTPSNPITPNSALFGKVVEILSANANQCIHEMGYPAAWERMENAIADLQKTEARLRQDNTTLYHLLQEQQAATARSKHELENQRRENIMLRNNAPEAYKLLEAKYFYVLDLLKQRHTPNMTETQQPPQAQQGPGTQATSQSNYMPGVGHSFVPSNGPHPNTVPMGPPPHAARKFAQQHSYSSAGPSHSQPVIPAKRIRSDKAGSAASPTPSIGLPPSLSRKPVLHTNGLPSSSSTHPTSSAYPPNATRTDPVSHANSSSAAVPTLPNNERPSTYALTDESWKTQWQPPMHGIPFMTNTPANHSEQARMRTPGAIPNPHLASGPLRVQTSIPSQPPSNPSTPATATFSGQMRPNSAGATAPSGSTYGGAVPPPSYPVSIDAMKKLDIRAVARSVKNALRNEASGALDRRPSSAPVEPRVEANLRNAELGMHNAPVQSEVQTPAQPIPAPVAAPVLVATPAPVSAPVSASAPAPTLVAAPAPAPVATSAPVATPAPAAIPAPVAAPMPVAAPVPLPVPEVAPAPEAASGLVAAADKADEQEEHGVNLTQIAPTEDLSYEITMKKPPFTTDSDMSLSDEAVVMETIVKETPTTTEFADRPHSLATTDAHTDTLKTETPERVSASSTLMSMEVDLSVVGTSVQNDKQVDSSDSHASEAMEISDDVAVPIDEDNTEEEPEEEWGDLTDDEVENNSIAGKRSVVDCISTIFYDDNEDERFCQLCNSRIQALNLSDAQPTFSECSMRDLITHAKGEHPAAWVMLRKGEFEDST